MIQSAPLYALSVWQPWAWLLFNGMDVLSRSYPLPWRMNGRRVVIHACRRGSFRDWEEGKRIAEKCGITLPVPGDLVYGAGLGTVVFSGCVDCSPSYWFRGPYGWTITDPQAWLEPVKADGNLGFWEWKEQQRG